MWVIFLLVPLVTAGDYVPTNYPNPRKGGFKECNMRSVSSVCDPDEVSLSLLQLSSHFPDPHRIWTISIKQWVDQIEHEDNREQQDILLQKRSWRCAGYCGRGLKITRHLTGPLTNYRQIKHLPMILSAIGTWILNARRRPCSFWLLMNDEFTMRERPTLE